MPLEIRELNIQVNIGAGGESSANKAAAQPAQQSGGAKDASDTVKQCVEEIMDIINKQKER